MFRQPIREIALLHNRLDTRTNCTLTANEELPLEPSGRLFHIQAEVNIPAGARLTFNIRGVPLILTSKTIAAGTNPASVEGQIKTVEILVDRAFIEAFVNHGEISLTTFVLPNENSLAVKAEGGNVIIRSINMYAPNNPAWKDGIGD